MFDLPDQAPLWAALLAFAFLVGILVLAGVRLRRARHDESRILSQTSMPKSGSVAGFLGGLFVALSVLATIVLASKEATAAFRMIPGVTLPRFVSTMVAGAALILAWTLVEYLPASALLRAAQRPGSGARRAEPRRRSQQPRHLQAQLRDRRPCGGADRRQRAALARTGAGTGLHRRLRVRDAGAGALDRRQARCAPALRHRADDDARGEHCRHHQRAGPLDGEGERRRRVGILLGARGSLHLALDRRTDDAGPWGVPRLAAAAEGAEEG